MKKTYYAVANIKKLLKKRGITLKDVATEVGISSQALLNVFSGQRNFNLELFYKIKVFLNLSDVEAIRLTLDDKISSFKANEPCIRADCIFFKQTSVIKPEKYIKEAVEKETSGNNFRLVRIISEKNINMPLENYDTVIDEVVLYLYTTFYRDNFNQIEQTATETPMCENEILTEIFNLMKGLDIKNLTLIRDLVKLFINYN